MTRASRFGLLPAALLFGALFSIGGYSHPEDELCPPNELPTEFCLSLLTGSATPARQLVDYVVLGIQHILPAGVDHILFVLGLFLAGSTMRRLLVEITAFTVAHSVTLALGAFNLVQLPSGIIEPLIALSIVVIGVENLVRGRSASPPLWRLGVIFGFGLLHGLGFANALVELDLSAGELVRGLFGFNVGVEIGQLGVVLLLWIACRPFFHREWYPRTVNRLGSAAISAAGLFLLAERLL